MNQHPTHLGEPNAATEHCRAKRPDSFWMHDHRRVFKALALAPGDTLLDMGCGVGNYALYAAECVGPSGHVFALDAVPDLIESLRLTADTEGVANLTAWTRDITRPLPLQDGSIDMCLLSTALHIPAVVQEAAAVFAEARRVLKPTGRMAIIDCKKEEMPFGPPLSMRLSAQEVVDLATPHGFTWVGHVDLGLNYLVLLARQ